MFVNGRPAEIEEIASLALSNYGHYTSMMVEEGGVRGLPLHLYRLTSNAELLFGCAPSEERIRGCIKHAIDRSSSLPAILRVTVFSTSDTSPFSTDELNILVTTRDVSSPVDPMSVRSIAYQRDLPDVKHVGRFSAQSQRREAQLAGFDDALFVTKNGLIAEGTTWNIGFGADDRFIWPSSAVLPGITQALLMSALALNGRTFDVRPVHLDELASMQCAFATNVAFGARPISTIDDIEYDERNPLLDHLTKCYARTPFENP